MRSRLLAFVAVLSLAASCTGGGGEGRTPASPTPEHWHGGTLRVAIAFSLPIESIDPREWYVGPHWELFRCCLLRTLLSYSGRSAVEGGTVARPDLAARAPDVSEDGLTWTFQLREGLRYGPPFQDTQIVAGDIVRALERLGDPRALEEHRESYSVYFHVVRGFREFQVGEASAISGLEAPDDHTLVVRLNEPTGDLGYRFTMPATAPIPEGATDGHPTDYFAYLVSSGPYMIEGSEDLDFSLPPKEQEPVSGFAPDHTLTLVRNPSWDAASDPLRAAYANRIEFRLVPEDLVSDPATLRDLAAGIESGTLDVNAIHAPFGQVRRYLTDPELEGRVHMDPMDVVTYLPMNLAVPPFDDVHVRRAVNLAIDKAEISQRFGRALRLDRTTPVTDHLMPDGIEGNLLADWGPSWAQGVGGAGDVAAARIEMRLSPYDRNGDGRCDDPSCRRVATIVDTEGLGFDYSWWWDEVRDGLLRIGIRLEPTFLPCWRAVGRIGEPARRVGIVISWCERWLADFPNGATYVPLLYGPSLAEVGNLNLSLLGATSDQLHSWGYAVTDVPSADERIERCMSLVGDAQTECWADLDRYLMEEVVPWVPLFSETRTWVVSERVAHYSYDQVNIRPAFDQIALVEGSE